MAEEKGASVNETSEPELVVEAILFSASKPLSIAELEEACGFATVRVRKGLRDLTSHYHSRRSALEVAKVGAKYALRLRPAFRPRTQRITPIEIPKALVKTLAMIAYYQPVKQSELVNILGPKIYVQIPDLEKTGLLIVRHYGQTKLLMTSKRFPEYFGIDTTTRQGIREYMAKQLGVALPKRRKLTKRMEEVLGEQDKEDTEGTDEALADADLKDIIGDGGEPADLADALESNSEQ